MSKPNRPVYVIGVGSTAYIKPRGLYDYPELALEATTKALLDAGINYDDVEAAFAGYCYGDSTCGQRALYALGMTQIPVVNVNNNCSTGSSALWLARQMVASGLHDCALAVGFEKMAPGSLGSNFTSHTNPIDLTMMMTAETRGISIGPGAAQIFGNGGQEYVEKFGASWEDIAQIASKNHTHSVVNPYSQFRNGMSVEEVLKDKQVTDYMTRAMCCPTSDGSSAAVLASEEFVKKHNLQNQAIQIAAMAMHTDSPNLYKNKSSMELTGLDMTRKCAEDVYRDAGITPDDVKVIELHDCFAANELLVYDGLKLTSPGKAHEICRRGDNTYGGKWVINPSGGLESKGHPLGATGLGMTFYLVNQLRGWGGDMQVDACRPEKATPGGKGPYALLHNLGLGGAAVMAAFVRPSFYKQGGEDGRSRLGYNHGGEYRKVTPEDVAKVRSKTAYSPYAATPGMKLEKPKRRDAKPNRANL
ncbi:thiolase-like protein [Atractiella rhizophila]|nr:thiolase-like protein [Atractiella rhizophila]